MKPAPGTGVPRHESLAHLLRDGLIESVHYGSVVVLAPDGSVRFQAGDIETAFFPRSTMKPLQAVAMVRLGLTLPADLLALSAASHSGEEFHLDGTRRILAIRGFTEADLGNPADFPYDQVERDAWLGAGRVANKLAQNCSGKHAAMLDTTRGHEWSTVDYLDPGHPLQRAIAGTVEELTGQRIAHVATDGCGAPLFSVSLRGLATAAGRIAAGAPGSPESIVAQAIRRHPEMVAGSRRDVTALMRAVPGLMSKDGFEAVQIAALPDGTSVAVKIADGGDRARGPVTAAALALAGVDPALLRPFAGSGAADGLAVLGDLAKQLHETV